MLKPKAAFLDFATLGSNVDTRGREALVDVRCHDCSDPFEVTENVADFMCGGDLRRPV